MGVRIEMAAEYSLKAESNCSVSHHPSIDISAVLNLHAKLQGKGVPDSVATSPRSR